MARGTSLRMLAGLLVGALAGTSAHLAAPSSPALESFITHVTEPAGQLFLRLLFVLVIPLILSALAVSVSSLGDLRRFGRLGGLTLAYAALVSLVAVGIGVTLVNALEPGGGIADDVRARLLARAPAPPLPPAAAAGGVSFLVNLVPANVVRAMADGDMLALMVFAVLLGVGIAATPTEGARVLERGLTGLFEISMTLLRFVLSIAPLGVACLLFTATARLGLDLLVELGAFVLVVLGGLALQQFGVYSAAVWWLGGLAPRRFFRSVRSATLTAFSTASSNATLPTALLVADEELALPRPVSRFVLTLGATANQNGTALFEGVTVLFLAQLFGVELTLGQQLTVVLICVLGGIGTAGVPAGSIPVVAMILGLVGVPFEGLGLVLGVDRLLDMCRTAVNVTGDLVAAVVISRAEGWTAAAALPAADR